MGEELIEMTQQERDWLDWLKQAARKQITQAKAAENMQVSERWVRQLLKRMKSEGDRVVIHKLRGRPSPKRRCEEHRQRIVEILSEKVYQGFGPTLASEYLHKHHGIKIGREALRQIMHAAGLWCGRKRKAEVIHTWRPRRAQRGELVQWDTSEHAWLGEAGPKFYLISMIDDATSRVHARFAWHDSTEENMRTLWTYLERHGRPVACYTDKASLFRTEEKRRRDHPGQELDARQMPPTQIGRALRELGIAWIPAHSPQAKGRVERSFRTAQDRLVKGLRHAGITTLEQANQYLEQEFLPWFNAHCTVEPGHPKNAHRPLGKKLSLDGILCQVFQRQLGQDYTFQFQRHRYQIARADLVAGMRGSAVRIEVRLDGSLAARFGERYLTLSVCQPEPAQPTPVAAPPRSPKTRQPSRWMEGFSVQDVPTLAQVYRSGALNRI